jgi:hypothetical protein
MNELEPPPLLRPSRPRPILGTIAGGAAGLAFYILFGCDSG